MLTLITGRIVHPHGPLAARPVTGEAIFQLETPGVVDGAVHGPSTYTARILDGVLVGREPEGEGPAEPVRLAPGVWALRVEPECGGSAWWLTVPVEPGAETVDLLDLVPVAEVDGQALARGPAGRGIESLTDPDARGVSTVLWSDGTATTMQLQVATLTLTDSERALLDSVVEKAREAHADAQRARSAAGTAMGHASAAADDAEDARTAATAAAAALQSTRDALAAGELDGHSPVVTMTGDRVTVDGVTVGPSLTGPPGAASTVPGPPVKVTWQGTRIVTDGVLGPDLQGVPGRDGALLETTSVLSAGAAVTGGMLTLRRIGSHRSLVVTGASTTGTSEVLATLSAGDAGTGAGWLVATISGTPNLWPVVVQGTAVQLLGPATAGLVVSGTITWGIA